ncbi:MAG: HNH endonuclease [Proteobacteria bacterium]|nr:MAG: HNH endonuclease [Pseudomonadota bacterium]
MNVLANDLSAFGGKEIISGLGYLVSTERKITYQILRFILEIDSRRLYLEEGFDSVYSFLRGKYKYSERSALRRINAAKLLRQNPHIAAKIQDGRINLSQLDRVQQCLKQESKAGNEVPLATTNEILEQVENKNMFETERVLAVTLNHKPANFEKVKPQADDSVRFELTFTREQFENFRKAQSYASHVVHENSNAQLIDYLATRFIQSVEGRTPSKPRPRVTQSTGAAPGSPEYRHAEHKSAEPRRKYLRRQMRRALLERSNHSCSHIHPVTGEKCTSTYQLQVDHIIPLAKGGTNDFENLRILCGRHNRSEAARWGISNKEDRSNRLW